MKRVMLDHETLSVRPRAVVLSIGAVEFSPADGLGKEIYFELQLDEQVKLGRHISPSTVSWWMQQSEEARKVLTNELPGGFVRFKHPVVNVLEYFGEFMHGAQEMWTRGFDDVVWLDTLHEDFGVKVPWKYNAPRDCRTLDSVVVCNIPREGTYHNALDDAKHQARVVIQQLNRLEIK